MQAQKQKFDNVGVEIVQLYILNLPISMRLSICNLMRTSLLAAMDKLFDLHVNQYNQLLNMPTSLSEALGAAIAQTWQSGQKVVFHKETKDKDDLPDYKNLEVIGIDEANEVSQQNEAAPIVPLMIRIRYK